MEVAIGPGRIRGDQARMLGLPALTIRTVGRWSTATHGPFRIPETMTLFDKEEFKMPASFVAYVEANETRPPAHNKKFDQGSKVARIPADWNVAELLESLELMHSVLSTAESELAEARSRSSNGQLSNRFEKLAQLVSDIREAFPAGGTYDPLKGDL